jgi:hypothetical protein
VTLVPTISVEVCDDDPSERDNLYLNLREELLSLDIEDAEFSVDPTRPAGAKADPASITEIVVALAGSRVLLQVAAFLRDWVKRSAKRKIVVRDGDRTLEITGATTRDNREVIDAFFADSDDQRLPEIPHASDS